MEDFLKDYKAPKKPVREAGRAKTQVFTLDAIDIKLRDNLHTWRTAKYAEHNGGTMPHYSLLKPTAFMSDEVLLRLVALSHWGKVVSSDSLIRDVDWVHINTHASELYNIAVTCQPPPPPSSDPLTPAMAVESGEPPRKRRIQKCSVCGTVGHNSAYPLCIANNIEAQTRIYQRPPTGRRTLERQRHPWRHPKQE